MTGIADAIAWIFWIGGAYTLTSVVVCSELQHDHDHWWCPACLLFGKDRRP